MLQQLIEAIDWGLYLLWDRLLTVLAPIAFVLGACMVVVWMMLPTEAAVVATGASIPIAIACAVVWVVLVGLRG